MSAITYKCDICFVFAIEGWSLKSWYNVRYAFVHQAIETSQTEKEGRYRNNRVPGNKLQLRVILFGKFWLRSRIEQAEQDSEDSDDTANQCAIFAKLGLFHAMVAR